MRRAVLYFWELIFSLLRTVIIKPLFIILIYQRKMSVAEREEEEW